MTDPFFVPSPQHQREYSGPLEAAAPPPAVEPRAEVVLTRQASRDGRPLAILRLLQHEHGARVEAQVVARGADVETRAGPYRFATFIQASNFLTEAVDSLTYLGCEVE